MFDQIQKSKKINILFVLIADIILTIFIVFVVFTHDWLDPVEIYTHGLINITLIVNLGLIFIAYFLIIIRNNVSANDLGLIKSKIIPAIILIVAFWGILQLINLVVMLIAIQNLEINPIWITYGLLPPLGSFIAQIFGNAFYEEMVFRAFLVPQFYFLFQKEEKSVKITLTQALLVSQAIFALIHVPIRLLGGIMGWDLVLSLLIVFGLGWLFALVYLRTKNIFIAMGIHALYNVPVSILNVDSTITILILTALLLIFWPNITRLFQAKREE